MCNHLRARWARLTWISGAIALLSALPCPAQQPARFRDAIDSYRREHEPQVIHDLSSFLAIPNLASDKPNIRRNADALMALMKTHGIAVRLLESASGAPPAVYGELPSPGATKTVVFYAHYDGQPVDTTKWITPPWQPVLRDKTLDEKGIIIPWPTSPGAAQGEWRLYARSASDDKAPIIAILTAVDALEAAHIPRSVNMKFFFEGEEEAGSGHLRELLAANADLLHADAWLFGDGPVHQSRRQQIVFGARGVTGAEITIYGPSHALHSGHYGNWAPNPVTLLANLIASMRNDDGRILVKHYHDDVDPITPADRRAIARIPRIDSAMRAEVMLNATEANDAPIAERIMLPALNLRGIQGGAVGATTANAIPISATASIDFRLVPHQTPAHVRQLIENHLKTQGYFVIDHDPTPAERMGHPRVAKMTWESGYAATRISLDAPLSRALTRASEEALGGPVVQLPILGGSVPLDIITSTLHAPVIVFPIVNHDNNQHASNENLRLQNLFDGIVVYAGAIAKLGQYWK